MPMYRIRAQETVYYDVEVEASSIDELKAMIDSGEVDFVEPVEGDNFMVDDIEEVNEE